MGVFRIIFALDFEKLMSRKRPFLTFKPFNVMIENLNPIPEEQANLHIVENMDVNNLPELMKSVLSLAHTPAEKDMLLMSALTACSGVLPNLYFKYGIGAKRYYPNLQLFIVGSATSCGQY